MPSPGTRPASAACRRTSLPLRARSIRLWWNVSRAALSLASGSLDTGSVRHLGNAHDYYDRCPLPCQGRTWLRPVPHFLHALYHAPRHPRDGKAGRDRHPVAWREGGRLHGRCLRPCPPRPCVGDVTVGRCGQPRRRASGRLSGLLAGGCADWPRATFPPAAPLLPGSGSRQTVRCRFQVPCLCA